jgi:lipoyl(octanoyl) transferase
MKIKKLGLTDYQPVWHAMQQLTRTRTFATEDEGWITEHFPVFTEGQASQTEHLLNTGDIPVIKTDRGGQVTYHGPGQLVLYVLCDLKRLSIPLKTFVNTLETTLICLLNDYHIIGQQEPGSPGIYVENAKIASLGLRIHRGCSYHGLSLNVKMDLEPFQRINPCGQPNRTIVQMSDFYPNIQIENVIPRLTTHLQERLSYATT